MKAEVGHAYIVNIFTFFVMNVKICVIYGVWVISLVKLLVLGERVLRVLPLGNRQRLVRSERVCIPFIRVHSTHRKIRFLVILHPSTISGSETAVHAALVHAHTCNFTALFRRRLANVHSARVTHAVRHTAFIVRTNSRRIVHVRAVERADTRLRLVGEPHV